MSAQIATLIEYWHKIVPLPPWFNLHSRLQTVGTELCLPYPTHQGPHFPWPSVARVPDRWFERLLREKVRKLKRESSELRVLLHSSALPFPKLHPLSCFVSPGHSSLSLTSLFYCLSPLEWQLHEDWDFYLPCSLLSPQESKQFLAEWTLSAERVHSVI